MKIVHLVQSLDMGGIETLILNMAKELKENGHEVHVIAFKKGGVISEKLLRAGIVVSLLDLKSMNILSIIKLRNSILNIEPDVVHLHSLPAGTYGRVALLLQSIPIVYHLHTEVSKAHDLSKSMILRERLLNLFGAKILAVSNQVKKDYSSYFRYPLDKITVISGGVPDTRIFVKNEAREKLGLDLNKTYLAIVASLTTHKNHHYLFDIVKKIEDVELLVAGDGPLLAELKQYAIEIDISDRIHFLGVLDEVAQVYSSANFAILTSIREGLGLSLIEAQRAGIPCFGTEVGGIPEVIDSGENGLLIPTGSEIDAARIIDGLMNTPDLSITYGKNARKKFLETYEIGHYTKELEKLYSS